MAARAVRLCDKHTMRELLDMQAAVESDPKSAGAPGSLRKYAPAASKLLDDIAQAITWKMAEKRAAEGMPVAVAGYTGRNSNRDT